ncbi:MAG: nitrous oxide-stimulated promoter family protein [Anaerotignum sp.]|nr:nitrous oxide-stimulated promoter family protein [Anaerotignum sp.]
MIEIYCHRKHGTAIGLCEDCNNLLSYAFQRIESCPFMETKTFCSNCKVHCYNPTMREKIRQVMAFSGPRLLLVHPIAALSHLIHSKILRR